MEDRYHFRDKHNPNGDNAPAANGQEPADHGHEPTNYNQACQPCAYKKQIDPTLRDCVGRPCGNCMRVLTINDCTDTPVADASLTTAYLHPHSHSSQVQIVTGPAYTASNDMSVPSSRKDLADGKSHEIVCRDCGQPQREGDSHILRCVCSNSPAEASESENNAEKSLRRTHVYGNSAKYYTHDSSIAEPSTLTQSSDYQMPQAQESTRSRTSSVVRSSIKRKRDESTLDDPVKHNRRKSTVPHERFGDSMPCSEEPYQPLQRPHMTAQVKTKQPPHPHSRVPIASRPRTPFYTSVDEHKAPEVALDYNNDEDGQLDLVQQPSHLRQSSNTLLPSYRGVSVNELQRVPSVEQATRVFLAAQRALQAAHAREAAEAAQSMRAQGLEHPYNGMAYAENGPSTPAPPQRAYEPPSSSFLYARAGHSPVQEYESRRLTPLVPNMHNDEDHRTHSNRGHSHTPNGPAQPSETQIHPDRQKRMADRVLGACFFETEESGCTRWPECGYKHSPGYRGEPGPKKEPKRKRW
ncbi:hypothetical protein LTR56_002048 [Elasticomyces elasticus]|nr:hypothetical protein LTR22_012190 [Elasticomyces elasticus]KAK3658191.1 hypothetical protein LTR56_002048 [Elasticomyces elasticus]KAK4919470.1 hypothetical protein LTR49_012848 [Elasticomyces elasticus]KAK5764076.1 hypothetical protein LTS12_005770 [Elasticomyces elasticus]